MIVFRNRAEAGQKLAEKLLPYKKDKPLILALPRGGVIIGFEVARRLKTDLDVLISRKIGALLEPELALGAISEEGAEFFDNDLIERLGVSEKELNEIIAQEKKELVTRQQKFRQGKSLPDLNKRTAIIVDDGVATGATAIAAIRAAVAKKPKQLILAVPACPTITRKILEKEGVRVVFLETADSTGSVGANYENFTQVTDEEVIRLINKNKINRSVATIRESIHVS